VRCEPEAPACNEKYSPILYKILNNERLMKQYIPKFCLLLVVVVSKRLRISAFLFGSPSNWSNLIRTFTLQLPDYAKFCRDRWNHLGEKRYKKFLHPSIFWHPSWIPLAKVPGLGGGVHQPPLATCKISSRSDNPFREFCCQTSSILLPAWSTNKILGAFFYCVGPIRLI